MALLMKTKLFCALIICALILSITPSISVTFAEENCYYRIIDDTTPFYSDEKGENLLFYLPYTYYVKVITYNAPLCHVEYCPGSNSVALDGYVPKEKLYFDDLSVSSPYPAVNVTTLKTTVLYDNALLTDAICYVFESRTLSYFGYLPFKNGENCLFVSYGNKLGYLTEKDVFPFTIPNHPNELTFLTPPAPPETEEPIQTENFNQNELRVLIIACLCIAGVFALIVALKNKTKRVEQTGYYDENEYE